MNNVPIKIIHKFKNNNRRTQYIQYIFIGSNVDNEILDILESIKNKTFYDTFEYLSKSKLDRLSSYYDIKWYTYFFNRYHLSEQFNIILKNSNKKHMFENKMGKEWVNDHLNSPLLKKINYSYASTYYDYLISRNKIKTAVRKADMDFRTYEKTTQEMKGGDDNDDTDNDNDDDDNDYMDTNKEDDENENDNEETINTIEDFDDMVNNNFNLEDIANLYNNEIDENSKNVKNISIENANLCNICDEIKFINIAKFGR
jgi:hypothetical protein